MTAAILWRASVRPVRHVVALDVFSAVALDVGQAAPSRRGRLSVVGRVPWDQLSCKTKLKGCSAVARTGWLLRVAGVQR